MIDKLDLVKHYKAYYKAGSRPELVNPGPARFLSVTGQGDPDGPGFKSGIEALYPVAYAIKFASKAKQRDFVVCKLEGLWWFDEKTYSDIPYDQAPQLVPRSAWQYRLLIRQPEWITETNVQAAVEQCSQKYGPEKFPGISLYEMNEGDCIQILHLGPFAEEPKTLAVLHGYMDEKKLLWNGVHHEIYLSDFRKTSPEKLKTILRQPVRKA